MSSMVIDDIDVAPSARGRRRRQSGERALDALVGRTVWRAPVAQEARADAPATPGWTADVPPAPDVAALAIAADGSLQDVAMRIDGILAGRHAPPSTRRDRVICEQIARQDRAALRARVGPEDLVILDDAVGAMAAPAARERGAHVLCCLPLTSNAGPLRAALEVLQPFTGAIDTYVLTRRDVEPSGRRDRLLVVMPAAGLAGAFALSPDDEPQRMLAWRTVLAGCARLRHVDHVGGVEHARPMIAAR